MFEQNIPFNLCCFSTIFILVHNFLACFLGVEKTVTALNIRIYHGEQKYYQKNKSETN
jgi:hypothetical protein